jgi:hypothetical protein
MWIKKNKGSNMKSNLGLGTFVDNCPWATIVRGQRLSAENFSIVHEIWNSWTIVEFHGHFFK